MFRRTDDLRIRDVRPLIPPAILLEEIPISEKASALVFDTRMTLMNILGGADRRLALIVGPCSIHDTKAALEYGERLKTLADRYADHLVIVMRTYFEKPRTSVGWKGLINDPDLDESFHINKGLRLARQLLLDLNDLGMPTASEFLDTQIPQHIADLTSWVAIGARTAESQVHRELASGLSMPVGFKNSTDGSTRYRRRRGADRAIAALVSVGHQAGRVGDLSDRGQRCLPRHPPRRHANRTELRRRTCGQGLRPVGGSRAAQSVMVDCSHGNSRKDHRKQAEVAASLSAQVAAGSTSDLRRDARKPSRGRPPGLRPGAAIDLRPEHHRRLSFTRADRAVAGAVRAGAAESKSGWRLGHWIGLLLNPQRLDRIDARRAPGGDETRHETSPGEQQRHADEDDRIERAHIVEQARHHARDRE